MASSDVTNSSGTVFLEISYSSYYYLGIGVYSLRFYSSTTTYYATGDKTLANNLNLTMGTDRYKLDKLGHSSKLSTVAISETDKDIS